MPEKLAFILDFTNACLPLKKYCCFRENGYKHGKHIGREWVLLGAGGRVGVGGSVE